MPAFISKMAELTFKYLRGELNEHEQQKLDQVINRSEKNKQLFESLIDNDSINQGLKEFYELDTAPVWAKIEASGVLSPAAEVIPAEPAALSVEPRIQPTRKFKWIRYAAVAALAVAIVISGLAGYHYWQQSTRQQTITDTKVPIPDDKTPIINSHGQLRLPGDNVIVLDTVKNGEVSIPGNIKIVRSGNRFTYLKPPQGQTMEMHTLVVENGGFFQVVLTDGTNIWLNSGSSLRYPTAFAGAERKVELTGEAYFEVAKNGSQRFTVSVNNVTIDVLGTQFNVRAYNDEKAGSPVETTVIGGSVTVNAAGKSQLLAAGDQIKVTKSGRFEEVTQPSLDKIIAWKNGDFNFKNDKLTTILSDLGRWYDVEVQYRRNVQNETGTGLFPRTVPLDSILKRLSDPAGLTVKLVKDTIVVQ